MAASGEVWDHIDLTLTASPDTLFMAAAHNCNEEPGPTVPLIGIQDRTSGWQHVHCLYCTSHHQPPRESSFYAQVQPLLPPPGDLADSGFNGRLAPMKGLLGGERTSWR